MIKRNQSRDGQYYFTVTAANGKVLVTSETYRSKRNMEKGIAALIKAVKKPNHSSIGKTGTF